MICLTDPPPPALAARLASFEDQFRYPLGPDRTFRIRHDADYPRFYRAMGEAVCFIHERGGDVQGVLAVVVRQLLLPDGTPQTVAYIGDLKVAPSARGGRALLALAQAADAWLRPRVAAVFSVVMDGTAVTPDRYTGRLGIPSLRPLGQVVVLRLQSPIGTVAGDADDLERSEEEGLACFLTLSAGSYRCVSARPAERSESRPCWLVASDGAAVGLLEDTRRAKRLFADDGGEIRSAHLSYFASGTSLAGASLLRTALRLAALRGLPALFVSVTPADVVPLRMVLPDIDITVAPATIYGAALTAGGRWNIHTAEI